MKGWFRPQDEFVEPPLLDVPQSDFRSRRMPPDRFRIAIKTSLPHHRRKPVEVQDVIDLRILGDGSEHGEHLLGCGLAGRFVHGFCFLFWLF